MIRYGILGFGHHGERRLAAAFSQTQHSRLAGLWRRDPAKASETATRHNIEHVFPTPEALCASPAVDAVFVTTPDGLHCEHTLLALQHGKAVLCEKPLAMNTAEAVRMLEASRKANRAFGVAQNFRYNRSLERMRDLIAENTIDKAVFATCNFCFLSDMSPRTWFNDGGMACGGPIGDVGIHAIDALRFILGQEVLSVSTIAHPVGASSGAHQLEETAVLTLEMSDATLATVQVSFRANYRTVVEIVGESGVLTAESGLNVDHPVRIVHHSGGKVIATEEVSNADAYVRMLDAFSAAVEGSGEFRSPGADGVQNQRVLDAAFQSWKSGCRQPVR